MTISLSGARSDTASPCIGVCSTVLGDAICRGCGRRFEEVRDWHHMSAQQKRDINLRLAQVKALSAQLP